MIGRWKTRLRKARNFFSRSELMSRLLGLQRFPDDGVPGLVLIQIDGFSHQELQQALKRKEMPFLARLLKREDYEVRRVYSGLPSNTPASQGELFYGVPGAVPAFGFFDHTCNRLCKMFDSTAAQKVEGELAKKGEPLLKGGSSYGNIYTGGASEPRWCFASMGWGTSTRAPGPVVMLLLGLLNAYGFVRALAFGLLEILLAFRDAFAGILKGERPKQEFAFVLSRVGMCIFLREWATEAAKMDVTRGVPVVHLNFVGYDEQSHRRGPDSAFAHWVLKGIDDAVKRIWNAAKHSQRRSYEIWIYSDHGQIRTHSYRRLMGKGVGSTVWELWRQDAGGRGKGPEETTVEFLRVRLLGGRWLQKLFRVRSPVPAESGQEPEYPIVTDLGPVALVYLGPEADPERRAELGRRLAAEGGVPLVVEAKSAPLLRGWTSEGDFLLPRDAERILGDHPFREQVLGDLERMRRHEFAGDLILFGWRYGQQLPLTFADENGSHGGLSPQECSAFVALPRYLERELLPSDTPRIVDLHRAALMLLDRMSPRAASPWVRPTARSQIRVMTYNVHSCVGMDQRHDPRRIARVIAHYHPDIIALQELEMGHPRYPGVHQAARIAELLQLEYHFHAVRELEDSQFGNAILSRFPLKLLRAGGLPSMSGRRGSETRGALWVEIDVEGRPIQVLNTHLGLWPRERVWQARALRGERWLGGRNPDVPVIVCGDLNCGPRSPAYRQLLGDFSDCQLQLKNHAPRNTWFTGLPLARLDHIFVSKPLVAKQIHIPSFHLAVMASDHFPLVADIDLGAEDPPPAPAAEKDGAAAAARNQGGQHVA